MEQHVFISQPPCLFMVISIFVSVFIHQYLYVQWCTKYCRISFCESVSWQPRNIPWFCFHAQISEFRSWNAFLQLSINFVPSYCMMLHLLRARKQSRHPSPAACSLQCEEQCRVEGMGIWRVLQCHDLIAGWWCHPRGCNAVVVSIGSVVLA